MFGLIFTILLSGCAKSENNISDIESVSYGTSFGECLGYCRNEITVTNSTIDFYKSGWNVSGSLPEISNSENMDAEYFAELTKFINVYSFFRLDSISGCPDCADGGAEWIEIKCKGKSHKVVFEYRNEPSETKEYIKYLRTYIYAFQVDSNKPVNFNERTIINQSGFVKSFVATRGSFQWLIGLGREGDTAYYFDPYLDATYKQDNLQIECMGVLGFDSTMINKPSPNDIPIPNFKVRNIKMFDIKPIED